MSASTNNIAFNGLYNTHSPPITGSYRYDGVLVKFDPMGVRQWGTYIGNVKSDNDEVHSLVVDRDNNIIVGGYFHDKSLLTINGYDTIALIVKFNPSGQLIWGRSYPNGASKGGCGFYGRVRLAADGVNNIYMHLGDVLCIPTVNEDSIFFQGKNNEFSKSNAVVKFNPNGQRIWGLNYGSPAVEWWQLINLSKNGDIYISGNTADWGATSPTGLFKKGHQSVYGGSEDGFLAKICQHTDTPKIEITSNRSTSICGGGQVIFTATDTFEGDDPVYTWYKNGSPIGMDTNILIMASIQDKDSFQCRLISSATCLFKDTVWSNTIVMKIKVADTLHIYDTMCELQTYWFNNQNVFTSGLYRDTFTGATGCDSFVFLHLHVKDTSYYAFSHTTPCDPNASYTFNGLPRTQSGIYSAIYLNIQGCDSTAVLNLTIRKPTNIRLQGVSICPNTSYVFDGIPRTVSGDYIRYYTNSDGCQSTDSLRIRILNNPSPESDTIPACAPFTFRSKTYTSSATVIDTIKSIIGNCDSVYRSHLIQLKPPAIKAPDTNIILCDSIRINNRLYTSSFSLIDTIRTQGSTQCDSLYQKTNYIIRYTPKIGLKAQDTFPRGSQVTLRPFSTKNYRWSTDEATQTISFKLTEDRQLYLIAWNEEPCRDTAYISLVAEDLAIVGIPTGFSPNGEHTENRTFKPNINGRLEYFHMMVFNRWGEKVYETFDTTPLGWNGIYRGEPSPAGLYGYAIEYRTLGTIYTLSGEVMLVR